MRAHVHIGFPGVEDGKVYPRNIVRGEVVTGELAQAAIAAGWAVELKDGEVPPPLADEAAVAPRPPEDPATVPARVSSGVRADVIPIPVDWKSMKEADLIALAASLSGQAVQDVAAASQVIEAELAARAPKG